MARRYKFRFLRGIVRIMWNPEFLRLTPVPHIRVMYTEIHQIHQAIDIVGSWEYGHAAIGPLAVAADTSRTSLISFIDTILTLFEDPIAPIAPSSYFPGE